MNTMEPTFEQLQPIAEAENDKLEKAAEKVQRKLEEKKIVFEAENPETGEKYTVVDFERLKSAQFQKEKGDPSKKVLLPFLFGDEPVLSAEQLENSDFQPKPFFYIPETVDDALDPQKIKDEDFHLGAWEMRSAGKQQNTELFPVKNQDSEKDIITELEARMAIILYNKNFGDGYRDENGTLMIRDKETREYKPINTTVLMGYGITPNMMQWEKDGRFQYTIQQCVSMFLPHLEEKGLLTPQDFREVGHINSEKRGPVARSGVSPSGIRMFNGVQHYIGKEFYGKNIKVATLNENTGGIYELTNEGKQTLTHLFTISNQENAKPTQKGYLYAGPSRTNVRSFNPEEYVSAKQGDESDEEFETRVNFAIHAISSLPKVLGDLFSEGVSLQDRITKEQIIIAEAAAVFAEDKEKYARFLAFVKKFQNSSLDVFKALAYGHEYAERLLDISERLPQQEMESVLENYSSVLENGRHFARGFFADSEVPERFPEEMEESIIRRGKDIINVLSETSKGKTVQANVFGKREIESSDPYESLEALETFSRSLDLINSLTAKDKERRPEYVGSASHTAKYQEGEEMKEGDMVSIHHYLAFDKNTGKRVHLAVQTRALGVLGENRNPELEFDGEARLNFLVDYGYRRGDIRSIEKIDSEDRAHAFSMRLDRESIDWNHDFSAIERNDAGREEGELSLDIGSLSFGVDGKPNESSVSDRVGRIVALGNAISNKEDARDNGERLELYHNRRSFSKEFGQATNFSRIVRTAEKNILPKDGMRRF